MSAHRQFGLSRPGAAVCLAALLAAAPASAGGPVSGWPSLKDMVLAAHARRALADDPALAFLNLGVQVRGGVATVWGPVPSEELARCAVRRLGRVHGVREVRAETYVTPPPKGDEGLEVPYVFREPLPAPRPTPAPPPPPARPAPLPARLTNGPPAAGPQASVSLQPPEALAAGLPAAPAAPPALNVAAAAIDQLRRADARFRPIAADLRGGTVFLHAGAARGEDVMAFARAVSQLPGIERVVVQPPR